VFVAEAPDKNEPEYGRFIKFGKISTAEASLTLFRLL
jgi:hypothetical protein